MSPWAESVADDGLYEHIRAHCVSRRCRAAQLDNSFEGLIRWIVLALTLVISVFLAYNGIRLTLAARRLPPNPGAAGAKRSRRLGLLFGLVFGAEIVLITVASNILTALGLDALVLPVIAAIVGVHFLPLAALFRVPIYYVTGGALIALGLAGVVGVLAGNTDTLWQAAVAYAAALVALDDGGSTYPPELAVSSF